MTKQEAAETRATIMQYIEMMLGVRDDLDEAAKAGVRANAAKASLDRLLAIQMEVTIVDGPAIPDDTTERTWGRWRGD